jgi:hypothetical protein
MFQAFKTAFLPAVLVALFLGAASQLPASPAQAALDPGGAWFLDSYADAATCAAGDLRTIRLFGEADPVSHIDGSSGVGQQQPIVQIGAADELIICVQPASADANVVFTTNGAGIWTEAHCGTIDTECVDEEGVASGTLTVIDSTNDTDLIAITFSCEAAGLQDISIIQDDTDDDFAFGIMCKGDPANISLTVAPDRIESSPALGNISLSLIRAEVTDSAGLPLLPGTVAEVTASSCALSIPPIDTQQDRDDLVDLFAAYKDHPEQFFDDIDLLAQAADVQGASVLVPVVEVDTNDPPDGVPNHSEVLALFHAEGCEPGPVTVTVRVEGGTNDVEATATITVVGPVAFITIAASPTQLICGEKSEITVTATDKVNQQVSDHTFIEVVTNWGGVLGGTGSSLTVGGPVDPVSNTTITLLKGTGKAFLLTSDTHIGQYEVLAASTASYFLRNVENHAPIAAQVTVTCTNGTPTPVTAPNTGTGASTGTIRPPNTGDAGLAAASNSSNAMLYVIAGAIAFVMAGLASIRYARR